MRFGRAYDRLQIVHWASYYLNYNEAKRRFKVACSAAQSANADPDFAYLYAALVVDLNKVQIFYTKAYAYAKRRTLQLYQDYGIDDTFPETVDLTNLDPCELRGLLAAAVEIYTILDDLLWYGKLNRDGFRLIHQKIDKACSIFTSLDNDAPKFHDLQFATQNNCLEDIQRMEKFVEVLNSATLQVQSNVATKSLLLESFARRCLPNFDATFAYNAVISDDEHSLLRLIEIQKDGDQDDGADFEQLLLALLHASISEGSESCVKLLLERLQSVKISASCQKGLHQLIVDVCWRTKSHDRYIYFLPSFEFERDYASSIMSVLDRLLPDQLNDFMLQKDAFRRTLLHYAADCGMLELCHTYLTRSQQDYTTISEASKGIISPDELGHSPLHLAVISGHSNVTEKFLTFLRTKHTSKAIGLSHVTTLLGSLLIIAIRLDFFEIVRLLIKHGADLNYQATHGKTALYTAAQLGRDDYIKLLLDASSPLKIDLPEHMYGWSPLTIACVEGNISTVKLLLEAGSNPGFCDQSGWTAKEHVVFRGHLKRAQWNTHGSAALTLSPSVAKFWSSAAIHPGMPLKCAINSEEQNASILSPSGLTRAPYATKETESHIFVSLGSSNQRKPANAFTFDPGFCRHLLAKHPENGYCLEIEAVGAVGQSHVVQLPLLEDMLNRPWLFTSKHPATTKLVFNLYQMTDFTGGRSTFVGSGMALLQNFERSLETKRESLLKDYAIPILDTKSLKFLGTVTFSVLIVTPYAHPKISPKSFQGFWRQGGRTQVIGHRGSGANSIAKTNLQIGENTLQSFLTAATLGATAVEFDVQLTKDFIPVIYHDFIVKETGGDIPLQTLTADQFMYLSKAQSPRSVMSRMAEARYMNRTKDHDPNATRPRSRSLDAYDDSRVEDLAERMSFTDEGREGIKGNLRGVSIQELFPTLEELLIKLPDSIAFDLEMKYPMLWEAEDRNMEQSAVEVNTYVDKVLEKVYALGRQRKITFSSFSPDVCILLSIKQQDYPVLFINKAGTVPVGDVRAGSTQQAIQFAKSWGLAGIVMIAEPFVMCPRLIQYARSSGLVCSSYGNMNDEPKFALTQSVAGLDALIVNRVRLISKTLAEAKPDQST